MRRSAIHDDVGRIGNPSYRPQPARNDVGRIANPSYKNERVGRNEDSSKRVREHRAGRD